MLDMESDRLALAEKFGAVPINVKERNPQGSVFSSLTRAGCCLLPSVCG